MSRSRSGLGIGLAVMQQLVQLHQGSIAATSNGLGKGARFTIQLPLGSEQQVRPAQLVSHNPRLDQLAVLVVDDSEDTSEMLAHLLTLDGAAVSAATSGSEALRILSDGQFDVVLSDISMPEMHGFEFLRRLRQLPGRSELPVLALTGFGRPEDVECAQAEGFFCHLTKPVELERLISLLQKVPPKVR